MGYVKANDGTAASSARISQNRAAPHQRHVQAGDGQDMGEARIAQRRLVLGIDAAAFAGDDGAGYGPYAARQLRADPPCHIRAQAFHPGRQPPCGTERMRQGHGFRRAIGKAGSAYPGKKGGTAKIAVARLRRPRRWDELGGKPDALTDAQIFRAFADEHAHTGRRIRQASGADLIEYGAQPIAPPIQCRNTSRQMRHQRPRQDRRGHARFVQLG